MLVPTSFRDTEGALVRLVQLSNCMTRPVWVAMIDYLSAGTTAKCSLMVLASWQTMQGGDGHVFSIAGPSGRVNTIGSGGQSCCKVGVLTTAALECAA